MTDLHARSTPRTLLVVLTVVVMGLVGPGAHWQPASAATGGWASTGSMNSGRANHDAVLLSSGKILAMGGGGNFDEAELFDPTTGTWSETEDMILPRTDHTATVLGNGKVLVAGGIRTTALLEAITAGNSPTAAEIYDPATATWTPTGGMQKERSSHTATLLESGKVLVVGGSSGERLRGAVGGSGSDAELYDPLTNTWTTTGSLASSRRSGHTATRLDNGKVLVVGGAEGGAGAEGATLASAELYDPATGTWTTTTSLGQAREAHSATLLADGSVVVAGGRQPESGVTLATAEVYRPTTATWSPTGSLSSARAVHRASMLSDGRVLAAGGYDGASSPLSSAELYNPVSGTWSATGFLSAARAGHSATLLGDGRVVAAGGSGLVAVEMASAEIYEASVPAATPLFVNDVSVSEGDTGAKAATFTVSLAEPVSKPVSVSFATFDGSAEAPSDYQQASGSVSFAPGETSKTVPVAIVGDTTVEDDETFTLALSEPVNAVMGDGTGTATIVNDDFTLPAIIVSDVTITEGNGPNGKFATFGISLSKASGQEVTVKFTTADGTATDSVDYLGGSGTLQFRPGETAKGVGIGIFGDTLFELKEKFFLNLSEPVGATLPDATAVGRILNDDAAPTLSISDVARAEGSSGPTGFIFTVSLSGPSGATTTVNFATVDGTAKAGSDYTAKTGTLTLLPGETTKTLKVGVAGDAVAEADEVFKVKLSSPVNASIIDGAGLGTIVNDD